jgi:hypothetical protein
MIEADVSRFQKAQRDLAAIGQIHLEDYMAMQARLNQFAQHQAEQLSQIQAAVQRLTAHSTWITESAQAISLFDQNITQVVERLVFPFDKLLLIDRATTLFHDILPDLGFTVGLKEDHLLVAASLPDRGWYLSGDEPCTLTSSLADAVREGNWVRVDEEVMAYLPEFKMEGLKESLAKEGVPEWCVNRLCLFLKHRTEGNHEEATALGVPLLDELAQHLYGGKSFTTKRSNRRNKDQSKPELALKTTSGPELVDYCNDFVQTFGCLQKDPDHSRLADEDYWNRHGILHGMMKRPMGPKDSAKCLMAIGFLFSARKEVDARDAQLEEDIEQLLPK